MKAPRFRIALIMAVVAIAALDFEAIRAMLGFGRITGELLIVGALPMVNVLVVGLLIGQRRPGNRPFLLGFEAFGAMALALYAALASRFPDEAVGSYLGLLLDPINRASGQARPVVRISIIVSVAVVMLGLPQLAFALMGGTLSRKYRITITKRPTQFPADR